MTGLTLAFTDEARDLLKSEGHSDFLWPSINTPAIPAIGDAMWLDDADPNMRFIVVRRTFIRSVLSNDLTVELELGLPVAGESAPG